MSYYRINTFFGDADEHGMVDEYPQFLAESFGLIIRGKRPGLSGWRIPSWR
jgi:hypothetical protein